MQQIDGLTDKHDAFFVDLRTRPETAPSKCELNVKSKGMLK
jgi:hypothetical protein